MKKEDECCGFALLIELDKNEEKLLLPQKEMLKFIKQKQAELGWAVTLTFNKEPASRMEAEKLFTKYVRQLNERFFRRAYKNGKMRLKLFAVSEDKKGKGRLHYHCAIEKPSHISHSKFEHLCRKCWFRVNNGLWSKTEIKPCDDGWIAYSLKELTPTNTDIISEHTYLG